MKAATQVIHAKNVNHMQSMNWAEDGSVIFVFNGMQ